MKQVRFFILAAAALIITAASCTKTDNPISATVDELKTVALSGQKAMTDALYDDVSMEVMQTSAENGLAQSSQIACATVTITPQDLQVWPKTVTVDYGSGCTGLNGFTRKGKIIYTLSQKFLNTGAVAQVSFDNYYVNDFKLEGQLTITNNGSANGVNVTVKLTGGKVTYPNGNWYTKAYNTAWLQTAGQSTYAVQDDEYSVTGDGSFGDKDGNVLNIANKTALIRKVSCANTVAGQADLSFNGIAAILDFGNGACDKDAVLTIAGHSYNITLP